MKRPVVVVGEVSLAARCAAILQARNWDVVLVADRVGLSDGLVIETVGFGDLGVVTSKGDVDLLVSAGNLRVLPRGIIESVRRAINFHDGPLPELGGRNVTSWAIAERRPTHGITWHDLTAIVDGGRILAEERFSIGADETAFELNTRCFEAALRTFPLVLDQLDAQPLEAGIAGRPPDQLRRSTERLGASAVLRATSSAQEFAAAVRALDIGAFAANTVGRARWLTGREVVVVSAASVRPVSSPAEPGTVLAVRPNGFDVALHDGVLVVHALEWPNGEPLSTLALGLLVGGQIPVADGQDVARWLDVERRTAEAEDRWRLRLEHLDVVAVHIARSTTWGRGGVVDGVEDLASAGAVAALWGEHISAARPAMVELRTEPDHEVIGLASPFLVAEAGARPLPDVRSELSIAARAALDDGPFLGDLIGRVPAVRGRDVAGSAVASVGTTFNERAAGQLQLVVAYSGTEVFLADSDDAGARVAAAQLQELLVAKCLLSEVGRTGAEQAVVTALNGAAEVALRATSVWDDLRANLLARADEVVLRHGPSSVTGGQLVGFAEARCDALRSVGVRHGDRVGIALDRSHELVVTLLAVLALGAAYVPLDPTYPEARRQFVLDDADLTLLLVEEREATDSTGPSRLTLAALDRAAKSAVSSAAIHDAAGPTDAAYLIYTSGSTGAPKAVVIEHRNVLNLFAGLDQLVSPPAGSVWLAATSLSFDISVLELLWTLHARVTVVVAPLLRFGADSVEVGGRPAAGLAWPSLSLSFFAAAGDQAINANGADQPDLYNFLLRSVEVADAAGLEAVWLPERHFHRFGGPYPNPAVLGAAVAARTSRVAIRAGSVVAALHHPARIAEEWSVVDRLSGGRVGVSFASGWMPRDSVVAPTGRGFGRDAMVATIDEVRRLWRGETVSYPSTDGQRYDVATQPRPMQAELPVWVTSAGTPETFELAGRLGAGLLTHLLGQDVERLTANIERYRSAWQSAGHGGRGRVTLMLHTYLTDGDVASVVHEPMKDYLRSAVGLVGSVASLFPTFAGVGSEADRLLADLDHAQLDALLDASASRYEQTAGLFGTDAQAMSMLRRVAEAGVDEVSCLVDFGVDLTLASAGVVRIGRLQARLAAATDSGTEVVRPDFAELVEQYGITHFQCTPSQATLLVNDPSTARGFESLQHLLVGGEALPPTLANELRAHVSGRVTNVYGPTETTVWSLASEIGAAPVERVSIGRPLLNQFVDVVDEQARPVPVGRAGELLISGGGVGREYRGRSDLTAERFIDRDGVRWYRTGDQVRLAHDGSLEFLGRADDQVKLSGHRIELGDIEAALLDVAGVREAAVVVEGAGAAARLAAYVVTDPSVDPAGVRSAVAVVLPAIMVPSVVRRLDRLPRTPNGKLDRRAILPVALEPVTVVAGAADGTPQAIVRDAWAEVLGEAPPPDAPFFTVGGNSLLAVRLFRLLEPITAGQFQLTDVFRYPTLRSMTEHVRTLLDSGVTLSGAVDRAADDTAPDRGARRRAARQRP
jgi:natural product biosynthesis luciferase-like monooxygenase protein